MGISNKVLVALAAVLGIGIIAKREEVGPGLAGLGTGLSSIGAGLLDVGLAPFKSIGLGLGYTAGGLTAFAESLGDIGRGIAALLEGLKFIPSIPGMPGIPTGNGTRPDDRNGNGVPLIPILFGPTGPGTGPTLPKPILPGYTPRPDDRVRILF